jgi:DNA-binding transcriptional regulator YhcF (GntR family)
LNDYLNVYGVFTDVDIVFDEEELSESEDNEEELEIANQHSRLNDVSHQQRQQKYEAMLDRSINGNQKMDSTTVVANQFNVSLHTVQRIWHRAKGCRQRGEPVDVSSKKPKHNGKKKSHLICQPMLQFLGTRGVLYRSLQVN